jgi:hypothetical protein
VKDKESEGMSEGNKEGLGQKFTRPHLLPSTEIVNNGYS